MFVGSNISRNSSCKAIYHPSRRQSKIDEQDMRNTSGGTMRFFKKLFYNLLQVELNNIKA